MLFDWSFLADIDRLVFVFNNNKKKTFLFQLVQKKKKTMIILVHTNEKVLNIDVFFNTSH